MKRLASLGFALFLTASSVFAAPPAIEACSPQDLATLQTEIVRWEADGYRQVSYMKNGSGEVIGFFASNGDVDMYAEVCDSFPDDQLTVSNEWYYWDAEDTKSEPSTWKVGANFRLTQDEGLAYIKVLNASSTGEVTAQFSVMGWDAESVERVVAQETVVFVAR